jgi:pre-mRNA-processing factor SLU7
VAKSKYEEDVFSNDHTAVWGSWYNKYLGWGYDCCHANEKTAYCVGLKGRERALARELKAKEQEVRELQRLKDLEQQEKEKEEQ